MTLKKCNTCNKEKDREEFSLHSTSADGYNPKCKYCVSEYNRQYREANHQRLLEKDRRYAANNRGAAKKRTKRWTKDNPEQKRQMDIEWKSANKDKQIEYENQYYERNKEKCKLRAKSWREKNKAQVAYNLANHRAAKKNATPKWAETKEIRSFYAEAHRLTEETGTPYQVDHIFPLNSKEVCGLHCKDNLRVITAEENNAKNNKLLENLV